eukprot:6473194-Amphidinium_carterae.5
MRSPRNARLKKTSRQLRKKQKTKDKKKEKKKKKNEREQEQGPHQHEREHIMSVYESLRCALKENEYKLVLHDASIKHNADLRCILEEVKHRSYDVGLEKRIALRRQQLWCTVRLITKRCQLDP